MRSIDADAIEYTHAVARNLFDGYNWNELVVTKDEIEDMPTIQPKITHEQAVEYLQSTGWLQEHDRQMMLDGVHRLTAQPDIVRCKDCKYAEYIDDVQTLWCTECGQGRTVAPDDFCSYAKRREVTT